jgi:hypothetical protein
MATELEHLITRDLRVVGREIAGFLALIVVRGGFPVGLDGKVTAAAAGGPAEVAGEAGHLVVAMRAVILGHAGAEAELAVFRAAFAHQLGARRLGVEIG